jgi:DNA-cytosine methyltransferase
MNKKIKVFTSFTGIGSQEMALRNIGLDFEVVGISEVDRYAILAYDAIHNEQIEVENVSKEEMLEEIKSKNIAYNFSTDKSEIPRGLKDIKKLYDAHIRCKNYGDIRVIDENNLPDFDLFTYSYPCFVAGTMVLTDKGYKNIEELEIGEFVMTHKNRFEKVLDTMKKEAHRIYNINPMCSDNIETTEEHPFYVRKRYREWDNKLRRDIRKFTEPMWVKACDLTNDCYLSTPINTNSKIPKWDGITHVWSDGRSDRKDNKISQHLEKYDFWWLIGRYLGDGWFRTGGGIIICCSKIKNEYSDITNKLDSLGFGYIKIEERTTYKIHISFKEIALFVKQFGKGAINKRLTNDIFDLPKELLKGFLDGYFSADGHIDGKYQKACSISRELIYGIGQCVAKVYNRPFSVGKCKRAKTNIIENRIVNQNDTYTISFKHNIDKQDNSFYDNGYLWSPINKIEILDKSVDVFNIEVENDNSYTVQNIIVHNCKNISVAGKQEGLVEGSNTQSSLLHECKRIISTKKPKYLLMENVKNLVGKNHIEEFEKLCDYLKDLGYNNYWAVLNGKDFGTPQNRERVIMISILKEFDNGYSLPIGFPLTKTLTDILDINVDKKEFFEPNLYNHINFNSTEKFNKLVMVGLLGIKGKDAIRRIYSENGLCPTLDAMQGGNRMPKVYLNDNTARRITPLECWRLQGFLDEDFYKAKNIGGLSNSKLYERAGRGIVVPMLEDVFNKLFIGKE